MDAVRVLWLAIGFGAAVVCADPPPRVDVQGDPLPAGAIARLGTERFVTRIHPTSLAFTFDGALLAAADYFDAYLWDAATGKRLLHLPNGGGRVALSPDGGWLASGNYYAIPSRPMRLWDVRAKQPIPFETRDIPAVFGFSPDGKTLAISFEKSMDVHLYDVGSWKLRQKLFGPEAARCDDLAFSPDSRMLAVGHTSARNNRSVGVVSLWDLAKKERREFLASNVDVKQLAFVLEQKVLFAMSEGRANGWQLDTGKITRWTGDFLLGGLSFDATGKVAAVAGRSALVEFDSYNLIHAFNKKLDSVSSMTLSANGKKLAIVPYGNGPTVPIQVWDTETRKPIARGAGHTGPLHAIAFSPDSRRLVTVSNQDGTFTVWDAPSAKKVVATAFREARTDPHTNWIGRRSVQIMDHGRTLILSGQRWDVANEKPTRVDLPLPREIPNANLTTLAPTGKWAVTLIPDEPAAGGVVRHRAAFWDVATAKVGLELKPTKRQPGDQVEEFLRFWAFANTSPLACFSRDHSNGPATVIAEKNRLEVWDLATQKRKIAMARGPENLRVVAFSPDDRLLAVFAHYEPRLEMVDLRFERKIWRTTWPAGDPNHTGRDIVFAPHGHWIAAMSSEWQVQLLETWTGGVIAQYEGHLRPINALAFAPDGRTFATASDDTTALLWSALPPARPLPERWKDDDHLWKELASATPAAYRIIGPLVANPERALTLFEKRLQPEPPIDHQAIQKDLKRLASDVFIERESAMKRLRSLGRHALPALQETLKGAPPLEVKRRLDELNESLDLRPAPDELRALRSILVLELIGTEQARTLLRRLTKGQAEAESTRQARASLARVQ